MIRIHHVLKDGTEVDDIKGHVIKAKDQVVLYEVINRINEEERRSKNEAI